MRPSLGRLCRRVLWAPAIVALVGGCAGQIKDPLAADRARLQQLAQVAPEAGWSPQATVLVSEEMLGARAREAVTTLIAERASPSSISAFGVDLRITPQLDVKTIAFTLSEHCGACVEMTVGLTGGVGVQLSGGISLPEGRLGVELTTVGTLEISVDRQPEGERRVVARVDPEGTWSAEVTLDPGGMDEVVDLSGLVRDRLRQLAELDALEPFEVASLPADGPVRIRAMRARAAPKGLAIEMNLEVLYAGAVEALPDPEGGWIAALPIETVLGVARAAALRAEPSDGFAPEPVRLTMEGDRFNLTVRLWKLAPRPTHRDFVVEGRCEVTPKGEIALTPETAREIGAAGRDLNPVTLLTRTQILSVLSESLTALVPLRQRRRLAGQWFEIDVNHLAARGDVLVLYGSSRQLSVDEVETAE